MKVRRLAIAATLIALSGNIATAQGFNYFCTSDDATNNFTASGDRASHTAAITIGKDEPYRAYLTTDLGDPPTLVMLWKRKTDDGRNWRETYVINTSLGIYRTVSQALGSDVDENPFIAVGKGTCVSLSR
jgi:hypothetical protein